MINVKIILLLSLAAYVACTKYSWSKNNDKLIMEDGDDNDNDNYHGSYNYNTDEQKIKKPQNKDNYRKVSYTHDGKAKNMQMNDGFGGQFDESKFIFNQGEQVDGQGKLISNRGKEVYNQDKQDLNQAKWDLNQAKRDRNQGFRDINQDKQDFKRDFDQAKWDSNQAKSIYYNHGNRVMNQGKQTIYGSQTFYVYDENDNTKPHTHMESQETTKSNYQDQGVALGEIPSSNSNVPIICPYYDGGNENEQFNNFGTTGLFEKGDLVVFRVGLDDPTRYWMVVEKDCLYREPSPDDVIFTIKPCQHGYQDFLDQVTESENKPSGRRDYVHIKYYGMFDEDERD